MGEGEVKCRVICRNTAVCCSFCIRILCACNGCGGEVLMTNKVRLENSFRDLVWVPRQGFCPLPGQSMAVTGLLTGHNTLRRHLHLLGLSDSPLCRRCGAEEETSAHILCECEALALHRLANLGCCSLEPEDTKRVSLAAIWNFSKVTGPP